MRKLAAAILAVPVIAVLYVTVVARRAAASRTVLTVTLVAFVGVAVIALSAPAQTTAKPPSQTVPVTSAAVRTDLRVGQAPNAEIAIAFSTPMNRASVAAALSVEPATDVDLQWDAGGTHLTVTPRASWLPGTFYTITVQAGALADTGRPLSQPTRAAFLVRDATHARLAAQVARHGRVALDTGFVVTFDRPVDSATVAGAVSIKPSVAGTIVPIGRRAAPLAFVFQPSAPLKPDTVYRVSLAPVVRDTEGAVVAPADSITVRTLTGPEVVRFRPLKNTHGVALGSNVSVRFSEPMNRASTKAAFGVSVGGERIVGKVTFAEHDTVLVFDPKVLFGHEKLVKVSVGGSAKSAAGLPLGQTVKSWFVTVKKKAVRPRAQRISTTGGGGAVGGGSWGAVEAYYLRLMNCTRTGGWVTSSGGCSSPGGSGIAPLTLSAGISSHVSRPYAKYLAVRGLCSHFINGNPGDRLRRAGYTSYVWAENLGCRSGNPYSAVLGSHLYFQSEKPYRGGHYVNMMNPKYDRAGIGVWVYGGRVRLVVDFYHPL